MKKVESKINCDLWSIPKGDRWNFTGEPFKVWQNFGTTDQAQNFRIQKNEKHRIMEDRIKFQEQKPQRSSFKITTYERFQKVNIDTLQELCQVRQQLGTA